MSYVSQTVHFSTILSEEGPHMMSEEVCLLAGHPIIMIHHGPLLNFFLSVEWEQRAKTSLEGNQKAYYCRQGLLQ